MLEDYGWQIKTWKLDEKEKMENWVSKHQNHFSIKPVFVNNKLAIEFKRLLFF